MNIKKHTSESISIEECKKILNVICKTYSCALDFQSDEISRMTIDGESGEFVTNGSKHFIYELLGKDNYGRYCSLVIVNYDDDRSRFAVSESDISEHDALESLVRKISGVDLKFLDDSKTYMKTPEFSNLAELNIKLAVEGKL